jgi:ankyrin repeat protein
MRCIILYKLAFLIISPGSSLFVSKGMIWANHPAHLTSTQPRALQQEIIKATVEGDFLVLSRAIRRGDIRTLKRWLDAGNDANLKGEEGRTLLIIAARDGTAEMVEFLLQRGAIANVQDDNGMSPLMMAAMLLKNDVVDVLLRENIDVNAKDNYIGETALIKAAAAGGKEIAQSLLSKGADVNIKNKDGMTALMRAIGDTVEILLDSGVDINAVDNSGRTALMHAIIDSLDYKADLLISKGADINIKTKRGVTALKLATESNFIPIINALRMAGAK